MARSVPRNEPLSEEDREYLHSRGMHAEVERLDAEYGTEAETAGATDYDPDERLPYDQWTVADLQEEIRERNENRPADKVLGLTGNKQQLVARLETDDAENPQD